MYYRTTKAMEQEHSARLLEQLLLTILEKQQRNFQALVPMIDLPSSEYMEITTITKLHRVLSQKTRNEDIDNLIPFIPK